ncbi:hypothetical protein K474DRAFT_1680780 [Panus rudis PR-1116 ss-1]|nr:hypothetical protein K474DRAFT_1680780 [Panus rudis PR-1116 ss-1]
MPTDEELMYMIHQLCWRIQEAVLKWQTLQPQSAEQNLLCECHWQIGLMNDVRHLPDVVGSLMVCNMGQVALEMPRTVKNVLTHINWNERPPQINLNQLEPAVMDAMLEDNATTTERCAPLKTLYKKPHWWNWSEEHCKDDRETWWLNPNLEKNLASIRVPHLTACMTDYQLWGAMVVLQELKDHVSSMQNAVTTAQQIADGMKKLQEEDPAMLHVLWGRRS